jgi:hypothetical protein
MLRKVLAMGLVSAMVIVGGVTPAAWAGDRGRDAAKGVLLGIGAGLVGALLGGAEAAAAPPPPVVYAPPPVVYVPPQPRVVYVPAPTVVYGSAAGVYVHDGHHPRHNKPPHKWGKHRREYGHGRYAGIPAGHLPPPEYRRGYLNVPPGHLPPPEYRH